MKAARSGSLFKTENVSTTKGIKLVQPRITKDSLNDGTYLTILKEIQTQKEEFESKFDKIKRFLENLEIRYFEQNKELLLKIFIHEISCLKNIEYDLNRVIEAN